MSVYKAFGIKGEEGNWYVYGTDQDDHEIRLTEEPITTRREAGKKLQEIQAEVDDKEYHSPYERE
jgi:hypothetical protein